MCCACAAAENLEISPPIADSTGSVESSNPPLVAFLKFHKVAGATVATVFRNACPDHLPRNYWDYQACPAEPHGHGSLVAYRRKGPAGMKACIRRNASSVAPQPVYLTTILRDPLDRILSALHFFYGGRYTRWAKNETEKARSVLLASKDEKKKLAARTARVMAKLKTSTISDTADSSGSGGSTSSRSSEGMRPLLGVYARALAKLRETQALEERGEEEGGKRAKKAKNKKANALGLLEAVSQHRRRRLTGSPSAVSSSLSSFSSPSSLTTTTMSTESSAGVANTIGYDASKSGSGGGGGDFGGVGKGALIDEALIEQLKVESANHWRQPLNQYTDVLARGTGVEATASKDVRRAVENLERDFAVVGLTRDVPSFAVLLSLKMNWPLTAVCLYSAHVNGNRTSADMLPSATVRHLRASVVKEDLAVYQAAEALHAKRVKEAGKAYEERLARFNSDAFKSECTDLRRKRAEAKRKMGKTPERTKEC
eukprot:CAMPEP_0171724490 /NCGR_PEP_ID=MMETSP0991-20121206/24374_1 /TAXON_ID=483369 /ORGANISM="non described non described, Strain CCMP2098" /LENGTH=484 /DNA_ID=CAMNT_0012317337 /DNA_START=166 /DNA_END=1620 /DNA_ORIENTATION=-